MSGGIREAKLDFAAQRMQHSTGHSARNRQQRFQSWSRYISSVSSRTWAGPQYLGGFLRRLASLWLILSRVKQKCAFPVSFYARQHDFPPAFTPYSPCGMFFFWARLSLPPQLSALGDFDFTEAKLNGRLVMNLPCPFRAARSWIPSYLRKASNPLACTYLLVQFWLGGCLKYTSLNVENN